LQCFLSAFGPRPPTPAHARQTGSGRRSWTRGLAMQAHQTPSCAVRTSAPRVGGVLTAPALSDFQPGKSQRVRSWSCGIVRGHFEVEMSHASGPRDPQLEVLSFELDGRTADRPCRSQPVSRQTSPLTTCPCCLLLGSLPPARTRPTHSAGIRI